MFFPFTCSTSSILKQMSLLVTDTEVILKYIYFIDYAITVVHFFLPFFPLLPVSLLPPSLLHFSSCPWVIHRSSLSSPFPILFLTSPCLFCTYLPFMFCIPCTFSLIIPLLLPADNPPCDLHFCDSVPLLVVCLVHCFFCFLGSVVNSCQFVVILLFIVFYLLFLR